jgi:hypothetical protein
MNQLRGSHQPLIGLYQHFRFEPGTRGLDQQCGSNCVAGEYHFFLATNQKFWSEPSQSGMNHAAGSQLHTTLGWFRPLFLVQTGKTWPIPSVFPVAK